ncbi:MAG: chorismate mutase [Oscillospiraceae bacterium]|nr:chorismate mutase [Oscillospiraceae bacterium]
MNSLEKARKAIDEIDSEMAELFEKRMDAVKEVAAYKKECGLPVFDAGRENLIIEKNSKRVKNDDYRPYYVNFLKSNMELSKAMQNRILNGMTVAYSGVEGAFAHIVSKKIFPTASFKGYSDFRAAYEAVEKGECDCAVLPVENSSNGDVGLVMDLAFFGSLHINGIYDVGVVQNLLAVKGTTMDEVKRVISHPQALGQCAEYIRKHGFETVEAVNTAVAAKEVAALGRHDTAAIGSDEAAEKYGLKKLEAHINGSNTNTTRFAVFARTEKSKSKADKQFVMTFTVKNEAGALGKAVSVIGEHGFNLRALKSRPTKELVWSYYFYAEGEGAIHSPEGEEMLKDLKKFCNELKVLGSFEKEVSL